jgi:proliferating cell nuclear antigen
MFKAVISDANLLTSSIPIIAEIIDEGKFIVDKDGISLLAPDRTMVSVVDFKLLSPAFEEYKVDEPVTLGLNLANLTAVLKRAKTGDKLILESGEGKLIIRIHGASTRTFEIPLIDVKTEKPPIDQLKFTTKVELETSILEEGVADAEVIGDAVFFEAEGSSFRMFAKGDVSSTSLEVKKGEEGVLSIEVSEKSRSQYPIDYLKKMIKTGKLAKQAVIEFGKDYPMRINFKVIDKLQMRFILAPRISEE